jgi:hypothetical protein
MGGDDDAREVVRRLHALGGGPEVVRKAAARLLGRLPPTDATELLRELMKLAREGWEPATCVLPAFTRALDMEAAQIPYATALRRVAALQDLDEVELLFTDAPAQREYEIEAAKRADSKLFSQPLGRLKQIARLTRNPDELAKLAVATDPSVIRNVLINPRLTEALVVRIAARRPARPEPLVEIWRSTRWSVRPMVRKALVFNPYFPPEVGAKIVPLLSGAELRELAEDRAVHPAIREQAQVLLNPTSGVV